MITDKMLADVYEAHETAWKDFIDTGLSDLYLLT